MRPTEVLEARTDLLDRLEHNSKFASIIDFLVAFHIGGAPVYDPFGGLPEEFRLAREKVANEAREKYRGIHRNFKGMVETSHVYRVTHDMCSLVEFAASQLEEDDLFDHSLAPTGTGIVCFDKPLPVQDSRGKTMLVHWMIWGPSWKADTPGITLFEFNDTWREPDEVQVYFRESSLAEEAKGTEKQGYYARVQEMQGRWATIGMAIFDSGESLGPKTWTPNEQMAEAIRAEGFEPQEGTNTQRYLHALWLLLNQTVAKVEDDEPADRATRRRATKRGLPSKVTVIRLRREVSTLGREPGESQVEWQHRWIVRGHWRWQAYGPGRSERRRIWINPFVKGPEGKPLVQSEKVYSLQQ